MKSKTYLSKQINTCPDLFFSIIIIHICEQKQAYNELN